MKIVKTVTLGAMLASAVAPAAFARAGGKDFLSEDYQFDQPTNGYEGRVGDYYCSYQRLPNRVCTTDSNGNERCQIKGWTLRQHCY